MKKVGFVSLGCPKKKDCIFVIIQFVRKLDYRKEQLNERFDIEC